MITRLLRHGSGAAAVEMALITPLLIVIMFGSMELGYYFYSEHVVVKAVRDGARFASRQGFENFTCTPKTVSTSVQTDTQNVTRTNQVATGGTPRLGRWTSNASITVTVDRCDISGTYGSFYEGLPGIPIIKVSATVPYTSLFSLLGFNSTALTMTAQSESPVMGI